MGGANPEKVVSINLTTVELYKTVFALIGTAVTIFAIFMGASYNFMIYTAERNFEHRLAAALKEGGVINALVDEHVETGKHSIEIRLAEIDVKLANIEALLQAGR